MVTNLNLLITLAEMVGGILSNSLSLLSDSLHNLSDTASSFIAYMAIRIGKKESNTRKTYGYKRVEILAALLNASVLIALCFFLFREAWFRWKTPEKIDTGIMLAIGMIGLLANVYAAILLHKDAVKSINVRAAYLHLIGDSVSSFAVIIGGVLIQIYKIYWIDPLITILIGLFIIWQAFGVLKQAVNILMQSTPENISISRIKRTVEKLDEVANIHHIHVWSMTENDIHLEAHIELKNDLKLSELKLIQEKIENLLYELYKISHITLQFEYHSNHKPYLIAEEG